MEKFKKVNRGEPIHGLEKIPDSELLRLSRQEVGQWQSYAQELEDRVKELEEKLAEKEEVYKLSEEDKREVAMRMRENEITNNLKIQNKSLNEQLGKLRKSNKEYLNKILQLTNQKK